jgi:hypothetical protein
MIEEWRKVKGFESYEVSNLGRIKSFHYNRETILKLNKNTNGYLNTALYHNKKRKQLMIHQLVAVAFLNHTPCGLELVVDHINDVKTDNRVENLQLVTSRFNVYKTQGKYSSKYKGVHFRKDINKWRSVIRIDGKRINLGNYKTELEASEAYQNKLKTL